MFPSKAIPLYAVHPESSAVAFRRPHIGYGPVTASRILTSAALNGLVRPWIGP
jgi:hypothetical protein